MVGFEPGNGAPGLFSSHSTYNRTCLLHLLLGFSAGAWMENTQAMFQGSEKVMANA